MDRFMLIVALVFAPLISGTAAAAEPWSSAAGSGSVAAQGLILENCQTRLANNTYSCKVKPSVGAPFTDTFTFTSPGVTSAHFDLAVGQLPGATFGCACAPSGTFADPIFDSTFVFQCVGPLPVGQIMDDECLTLLREHRTWYVPTLGITHLTPDQSATSFESCWVAQRGLTPDIVKRAEGAAPEHRGWFQKALLAGIKMALGSDLRPLRDSALLEMELWVKDGATPQQTIDAATRHAADLCGVAADLGTVEVGKIADLIVVRDSPLDDIHHLRSLQLVLKDGRVVTDHRDRPRT